MTQNQIHIEQFKLSTASEQDFDDLVELLTQEFIEINPKDPIPPRDATRNVLLGIDSNAFVNFNIFLVRNSQGDAIGWTELFALKPTNSDYAEKKHVGYLKLHLLPDWRGNGYGLTMMRYMIDIAKQAEITMFQVESFIEAGKQFMKVLGATIGLVETTSRAYLADMNWDMIDQWILDGQKRNPTTNITRIHGLVSEDDAELTRYAIFESQIRRDIPQGDLQGGLHQITADEIRQNHEFDARQNREWLYYLATESNGRYSGSTRMKYRADFGHYISQSITGVLPEDRGRGLGKWLKASMLRYVKQTYSDVQYVQTNNATVNEPMLAINQSLGFKPYKERISFNLEREKAEANLGN